MRKHYGGMTACIMLAVLLMFSCLCLPARAVEASPDLTTSGTIRITLCNSADQSAIRDIQFILYRVADVIIGEDQMHFEYTSDFHLCGIVFKDIFTEDSARELAHYAQIKNLAGQVKISDDQGRIVFSPVSQGLYLIQEAGYEPEHKVSKPFVICVPMREEGGTTWNYDIDATPKAGLSNEAEQETTLTVRKVWDSGGQSVPDNVKVSLLRGNQIIETVQLSAQNNWTYTWDHLEASAAWDAWEESVPAGYSVHYSRAGKQITITNVHTKKSSLIQTGRVLWPVFVLAGTGMMLMLMGLWLLRGKRGKKCD